MEDEPQAEYVANGLVLSFHILDVDHLWSHIARSSTSDKEIILGISEFSQPEIGNHALPSTLCSEDEVLRF